MKIMNKGKIRLNIRNPDLDMGDINFCEISVLQRVCHEKVVSLFEILEDSINFYLVMEFLGTDLKKDL